MDKISTTKIKNSAYGGGKEKETAEGTSRTKIAIRIARMIVIGVDLAIITVRIEVEAKDVAGYWSKIHPFSPEICCQLSCILFGSIPAKAGNLHQILDT